MGDGFSTFREDSQSSTDLLLSILNSLPDVLLILDRQGRYREILSSSPYLIAPRETLIGKTIRDALPESAAEDVQRVIDRTLDAGAAQEHEYCLPIEEKLHTFRARIVPFKYGDEECVLWVARDITELRAEEEARRRLEARMRDAEKLESLGILAGGIAHDFNNLLVGILANTSLVMESLPRDAPELRYLEDVESASRCASDLCKQMLAYSGRGSLTPERLDLNATLREMLRLLDASLSKEAHYVCDFATPSPIVDADPSRLRQVFMNMLTNASEALEGGPGEITISTGSRRYERAELAQARVGNRVDAGDFAYFEVRDRGCGMDEQTFDRLFDPFFSTKFAGRGLGMASAVGIVRSHAGAIFVDTAPGDGTTIRVLLPTRPAADECSTDEAPDLAQMPADVPTTVLCVDDEAFVRDAVRRSLEPVGYDVLTAEDSHAALEILRRRVADVKLVILDMTMPELEGDRLLSELLRVSPLLDVVVISGHEEEYVRSQFDPERIQFLQKPFTSTELRASIVEAQAARGAASDRDDADSAPALHTH